MDKRFAEYERRAAAAMGLLEAAIRVSGIENAHVEIQHDRQGLPYIDACSGGAHHRIELILPGRGAIRLTRVMKTVLEVI